MQATPNAIPDDAMYRRIAWRILPFLFVCYMVNFIDRVNIGFAKLQFLHDLHLDDAVFGLAAGMFFVGYVSFELPSNLLLARIGARRTLLRIMGLWGLFTVLMMFAHNATSLYLLRFLIGAAEAGFFPGLMLYLTYWFPDRVRGRITSKLIVAVPLAGIVGGPLSGWIMSRLHGAAGLQGWQWLFLAEGLPAIVLGALALVWLDDGPRHARWLADADKRRVEAALQADREARARHGRAPNSLREVLRSPRVYLLSAVYFTVFLALNAVGFWIPTLLRSVGVHRIADIGLLSGAISVCTAIGLVLIGHSSDRRLERRWHLAGCGFAVAASFLLLPLARDSVALTVLLLIVASVGVYASLSLFWTLTSAHLQGGGAAAGMAWVSSIGALGGAVSPSLIGVLKAHTGSLYPGLAVVAGLLVLGMLGLLYGVPAKPRASRAAAGAAAPAQTVGPN